MGFALSQLELRSTAFQNNGEIPPKHTGEGEDVSPSLSWSHLPDGAQALALICHDPDAPLVGRGSYGFVHWVLYNVPASVAELAEGVQGYTNGKNDFGNTKYGGPMPPEGHGIHHYFFWLLALDRELDLPAGLSLWQLLERIEPHVIGMNRLVGTYSRG
jgi:Raf kinase inhibitor-like YbhB/YbcL family protein